VEQNRGPGYEYTTTILILFLIKALKIYNGAKTASSKSVAGKSGC
jgi:hypothetical protein